MWEGERGYKEYGGKKEVSSIGRGIEGYREGQRGIRRGKRVFGMERGKRGSGYIVPLTHQEKKLHLRNINLPSKIFLLRSVQGF